MKSSTLSVVCALLATAAASVLAAQAASFKLNDGGEIPAIALGTWLGRGPAPQDPDAVQKAVQWALEAGYRHVDTASVYAVEDQVGRGISAKLTDGTVRREQLFVTTKLWNDKHARAAVVPALRQSLKDLQLNYVDLYLIHWPVGVYANGSHDLTDYLETWQGMVDAKNLGLARHIGLSNFNQQQIDRIIKNSDVKPAALQVKINLNQQQPALLSYCKSQGIVVMGYTPIGSLFTAKANPLAAEPRVDTPEMVAIAAKYNKTVPQINLRYLYELGVVTLPKSLKKDRIQQNIDIFNFRLSAEDKRLLQSYDNRNRALPIVPNRWLEHPFYPYEKTKYKLLSAK